MPISFSLSDDSARIIGAWVGTAVLPTLLLINEHTANIDRNVEYYTSLFRPLPDEIGTAVSNGVERISIRVFETNATLLDHIEAARWAIAYLAYNLMVDVYWRLRDLLYQGGRILDAVRTIHVDLVGLAYEVTATGARIVSLLEQILAALRGGITFTGTLAITITTTGGGGFADFLKDLDLWKLLALLAILAGFVAALGLAMSLFSTNALIAAVAITAFLLAIAPLVDKLAGFDWGAIGRIGVGLAALAAFVAGLGYALRLFTKDAVEAIPALNSLIEKLGGLATSLAALSLSDVGVMALALTALAGFVAGLAGALRLLNVAILNALGPFTALIDQLGSLATKLAALSLSDVGVLTLALAALAGFVAGLAAALRLLSAQTLNALGPLGDFIDRLGNLGTKLAALKLTDVGVMAAALVALAGFVAGLAAALRMLSAQTLNALGPFGEFIDHLGALGTSLAALKLSDVGVMALALAALAAFVAGLAAALGLVSAQTLKALGPLGQFIDTLSNLATTVARFTAADLVSLGVGLAELALFVAGLAWALGGFDVEVLKALPGLTGLISALQSLAVSMAAMSAGDLVSMGIAFALIAGFVWALAAALKFAEGPLKSLATVLTQLRGLLTDIVSFGDQVLGFLGNLGGGGGGGLLDSLLGGLSGLLPSLMSEVLPSLPSWLPDLLPLLAEGGPPGGGGSSLAAALPSAAPAAGVPDVSLAAAFPSAAGGAQVDQSVNVGGISVSVNAERLEADSAQLLTDDIIQQLQARLGSLRAEQDFRTGARPEAA